jgi:hypothetical protein
VSAAEKVLHGLVKVAQRLLLNHLTPLPQPQVLRAGGGELSTLLQIARRRSATETPPRLLLDGQVPDISGVCAMP